MKHTAYVSCFLALSLAGLTGCSSQPAPTETKRTFKPEKIQGKAQVLLTESSAADAALNAGGSSVYIWEGARRYRLFLRTPYEMEGGKEYLVEGYNAQKIIDELGDPDRGANGYPLAASCERAVKTAWPGLPFDVSDGQASVLRTRIKRYPARTVFLVTKIQPAPEAEKKPEDKAKPVPEVTVPAEKQKALLAEGTVVQPAPLWEPKGGVVNCKVIIGTDGKVEELETGLQLCEAVPWSTFRYQPTLQKGKPVKVKSEVEIRFEVPKST